MASRIARAAWERYLVGPGKLCPELPFTQRPKSKIVIPTLPRQDRYRQPRQRYHLFKHQQYQPSSFAANLHNEVEALKARVLKLTPPADGPTMAAFVQWVKTHFKSLFPGLRKRPPTSMEAYLQNSNASPGVKRVIRRAHEQLVEAGYSHYTRLTQNELHSMTKRKSFVKVENDLYQSPGGDLKKAPRLIQGASPEFISFLGPMFMSIQAEIKRVWNAKHYVWFTSGAHARGLADYICKPVSMAWFENDVSAFDTSISEALCQLEVWLARRMGATPVCLQLMRANIMTHGVTSKGVKYRCVGTRKSGDPFTSCFNSVLNGLMHVYAIYRGGVQMHTMHRHVRMLVQGDDNLLRHTTGLTPQWRVLSQLGFKCENLYRLGPTQAEFCSSLLYPVEGGFCFGPKLGRVINKLLCFNNPPLHVHPHSIAKGVALGLTVAATFIIPIRLFVEHILKLTHGVHPFFIHEGDWRMKFSACRPNAETQGFIDDRYGLSLWFLNTIKNQVAERKFGDYYDTPSMRMVFDRDTAGTRVIFA